MVDLLAKEAYVSGRRAPHSEGQATDPTASRGVCLVQDVGTILPPARATGNYLCEPNDRRDDMSDTVNNNGEKHRFELEVDGHLAAAYYERSGSVITFEHTEVPAELGGKGVGSRLVKGALDQVRAEGLQVVAQCPFVKAWIGKNPAYADLLKN